MMKIWFNIDNEKCPNTLLPSFITETNGNVLALTANGNVQENGVNMPSSSGTAAVTYINGVIYRQTGTTTGPWYAWDGFAWISVATLPACDPPAAFSDDFNSLSLYNTRNSGGGGTWRPSSWFSPNDDGFVVNQGWMVNPFNPATPITSLYTISGGNLNLGLQLTPSQYLAACGNKPYVSSQLLTQTFRQLRGYFEARIRVQPVVGTVAAFWLMNDQTWPPEIDIVEIVIQSTDQLAAQTLWYMDQTTAQNVKYLSQGFNVSRWHTYGVDWQAGTMTFYIDRVATLTRPTPTGYTTPMFPLLSFESGGSWSGTIPAGAQLNPMLVDYVKIWANKPF